MKLFAEFGADHLIFEEGGGGVGRFLRKNFLSAHGNKTDIFFL